MKPALRVATGRSGPDAYDHPAGERTNPLRTLAGEPPMPPANGQEWTLSVPQMEDSAENIEGLAKGVAYALSTHGHAFQYAALEESRKAFESRASRWTHEATEFPIRLGSKESRIDFILREQQHPLYLSVECKKTNPRYSKWVFVQTPSFRRDSDGNKFLVDMLNLGTPPLMITGRRWFDIEDRAAGLGLVLQASKSEPQSNEPGGGRRTEGDHKKAIEHAAYQAVFGSTGLQRHWIDRGTPERFPLRFVIPVVLTTAELYFARIDLSMTDAHTGAVDKTLIELEPKDWVYLQHHVSPSLRLKEHGMRPNATLGADLEERFVRTVPVVRAPAFQAFLNYLCFERMGKTWEVSEGWEI